MDVYFIESMFGISLFEGVCLFGSGVSGINIYVHHLVCMYGCIFEGITVGCVSYSACANVDVFVSVRMPCHKQG